MSHVKFVKAFSNNESYEVKIEYGFTNHFFLEYNHGEFVILGSDFFFCFNLLREKHLEPAGISLCCKGCQKNIRVSPIQQAKGGLFGYQTRLGQPAKRSDKVFLLDFLSIELVATVEEQREFREEWALSILSRSQK